MPRYELDEMTEGVGNYLGRSFVSSTVPIYYSGYQMYDIKVTEHVVCMSRMRKAHAIRKCGNLMTYLCMGGMALQMWILNIWDVTIWTGLNWLQAGYNVKVLCTLQ